MTVQISPPLTLTTRIRRIDEHKAVLRRLVASDLKVKYEGATLGFMWSILEPLLVTLVYYFIFTLFRKRLEPPHYVLFLITGVLPWQWVTGTISGSLRSLRGNSKLITKIDLPREIFPLSVVAGEAIEFLLTLPILVAMAAVFRTAPSWYVLMWPLAFAMQFSLLTGIAFLLAVSNTLLRDVERVIKPVVRIFFYMSPILYPIWLVLGKQGMPHAAKTLYQLNPFVGILEIYRAVWYPDHFLGWKVVFVSAVGCAAVLVIGWRTFTRLESRVLKEL